MSGVIYAVIVVMWAAFLVPMWLRRHDQAAEAKSVDRFERKMRVLARRAEAGSAGSALPAVTDRPVPYGQSRIPPSTTVKIVGPRARAPQRAPQSARPVDHPSSPDPMITLAAPSRRRLPTTAEEAGPVLGTTAASWLGALRREPRAPLSMVARRRRVLLVLLAASLLLVALAALGKAPWWSAGVSECLVVAYVIHLRVLARRRATRARRWSADEYDDWDEPATVTLIGDPVVEPAHERGAADAEEHLQEPVAEEEADDGWRPVSVPVPTYVTAPRATRAIRRIDLGAGGAWTSGRLVADAAAAGRAAASTERDDADGLTAQRAVGD